MAVNFKHDELTMEFQRMCLRLASIDPFTYGQYRGVVSTCALCSRKNRCYPKELINCANTLFEEIKNFYCMNKLVSPDPDFLRSCYDIAYIKYKWLICNAYRMFDERAGE